jgi:hypothetical protein
LDSSAASPTLSRNGIGPRKDRKPSLYLGFEQEPSSNDGLDESNARLSQATTDT